MSPDSSQPKQTPIGEALRLRRVEALNKGLHEMAKLMAIAPAHLTDIEKGRRAPSDALLVRAVVQYQVDEADLRTAWTKADGIVTEVATQDSATARKVPIFLRTARDLSP